MCWHVFWDEQVAELLIIDLPWLAFEVGGSGMSPTSTYVAFSCQFLLADALLRAWAEPSPERRDGARIPDRLFGPSSFSNSTLAARGIIPAPVSMVPSVVSAAPVKRTHDLCVRLLARAGSAHGIRLAGARLAVGEDGDIVALHE
jgi:hypothetical protein